MACGRGGSARSGEWRVGAVAWVGGGLLEWRAWGCGSARSGADFWSGARSWELRGRAWGCELWCVEGEKGGCSFLPSLAFKPHLNAYHGAEVSGSSAKPHNLMYFGLAPLCPYTAVVRFYHL